MQHPPFTPMRNPEHLPMLWLLILIAVVLAARAAMVISSGDISADIDPDTWLRLTLVEQLHSGGGWYNHDVPRSNTPYGTTSHWSRAIDVLLLLPATVLSTIMPLHKALAYSAQWLSWVALCALVPALLMAVRCCGGRAVAQVGVVCAMVLYVPFIPAFMAGDVDQPPLLTLALAWQMALAFRMYHHRTIATAVLLGLVGALGIWVSVEYILACGTVLCWVALLWVRDGNDKSFIHCAIATALFVALAFVTEQPAANWLLVEHDSLSIVHVGLFALAAGAAAMLYATRRKLCRASQRLAAAAASAIGIGGIMQLCFSGFYNGPLMAVSEQMQQLMLPHITELQPIYVIHDIWQVSGWMFGVITLPFLLYRASRNESFAPLYQLLAAGVVVFSVLFFLQNRWLGYMVTLHILALALMLDWLVTRYRLPLVHCLCIAVVICAIPFIGFTAQSKKNQAYAAIHRSACHQALRTMIRTDYLSTLLPRKTPLSVITRLNDGTYILYWTPHHILASNYHRNEAGYIDQHTFMTTPNAEDAKRIVQQRGIEVMTLCSNTTDDMPVFMQHSPLPLWLKEVTTHPYRKDGVLIYRMELE